MPHSAAAQAQPSPMRLRHDSVELAAGLRAARGMIQVQAAGGRSLPHSNRVIPLGFPFMETRCLGAMRADPKSNGAMVQNRKAFPRRTEAPRTAAERSHTAGSTSCDRQAAWTAAHAKRHWCWLLERLMPGFQRSHQGGRAFWPPIIIDSATK